jgi:hypothetical protein
VDQVVRDAGMIGVLGELLLEDRGRLEVRGISLVGRRLRPGEVQGVEDLCLVVVRILRRECLVGLGARELARALGAVGEVRVVGCDRLEVVALALGLRAHLAALVDRVLRLLRAFGRGADALEGTRNCFSYELLFDFNFHYRSM